MAAALRVAVTKSQNALHSSKPACKVRVRSQRLGYERPLEEQLRLLRNIITTHKVLVPSDPTMNKALEVWKLIKEVPPQDRLKLLDVLDSRQIVQLWRLADAYARTTQTERALVLGPNYSVLDEFPSCSSDAWAAQGVFTFEGKAALPVPSGLIDRFRKLFAVLAGSDEVIGRVDVKKGFLGNALYPLYFKADFGQTMIAATGEVASMELRYAGPDGLGVEQDALPKGWPMPVDPRFPFSGNLVDYLRPVGPGVFVGIGWKYPESDPGGRKFLAFLMVRSYEAQV